MNIFFHVKSNQTYIREYKIWEPMGRRADAKHKMGDRKRKPSWNLFLKENEVIKSENKIEPNIGKITQTPRG